MEERLRIIERWGLLAGVTGVAANLLLIALYVSIGTGDHDFRWTGPANDVMGGIVSSGASVPLVLAIASVVGTGRVLRVATVVAVCALSAIVGSSLLLVTDVLPFEVQVFVAVPAILTVFAWTALVGRVGGRRRTMPRGLARAATAIGLAAIVGTVLGFASLLLPAESATQYAVGGAGLLAGIPAYLAFPVWLIRLSRTLRHHVLGSVGTDPTPTDRVGLDPVATR